jgi:diguanylate cyclase (GGDEF)-like protein
MARDEQESRRMRTVNARARAYVWTVITTGVLASGLSISFSPVERLDLAAFVVLALGASLSQILAIVTSRGVRYELTPVFIFAAVLLLPVGAALAIMLIALAAEWLHARRSCLVVTFNVGNLAVGIVLARLTYSSVAGGGDRLIASPVGLVGSALAIVVFTVLVHGLIAGLLLLRDPSARLYDVVNADLLITDATLFCSGVAFAALWLVQPLLVVLVLFPLLLTYRALRMPLLREEADTDPKTGLRNTRCLTVSLASELQRAARFSRPLAVVMADLDLLREVNNRHGHLAGDAVIKAVADVIAREVREFDVAARFGGEEFVLVLHESDVRQGLLVAERLRKAVEAARIVVSTSAEPLRVTLTLGVAAYPEDGATADELLHRADLAMYRAKSLGRNQTCPSESIVDQFAAASARN